MIPKMSGQGGTEPVPVCLWWVGGGVAIPSALPLPLAKHRNATPPTPAGGPSAIYVCGCPYVLNFLDRCVDIRATSPLVLLSFFAFTPTGVCFAPENVLLQVSCMVRFPFGATKKLPSESILANMRLFFAFAVFFTSDAAFPQGSVSLPPAFCYLK